MITLEAYQAMERAVSFKLKSTNNMLDKELFDIWGLNALEIAVNKYDPTRSKTLEDYVFMYTISYIGWNIRDRLRDDCRTPSEINMPYDDDSMEHLMINPDALSMEEIMDIKFAIQDNEDLFKEVIKTGKTGSSVGKYHGYNLKKRNEI